MTEQSSAQIDLNSPLLQAEGGLSTPHTPVDAVQPETSSVPPQDTVVNASSRRKRGLKKWQAIVIAVLVVLLGIGSAGAAIGFYTYGVMMDLKSQALEAREQAKVAYGQFKAQNLPATDVELKKTDEKLKAIRQTYNKLAFYKFIPVARNYYLDGEHGLNAAEAGMRAGIKSIETVTPYADVLGFTGEGTFTGGTIEDRLKLLLQTLDKVTPQLDEVASELKVVEEELAQIDPNRYPEEFRGIAVRQLIQQGQGFSVGAYTALTDFRPVIQELPAIAGGRGERKKYLMIFQNENEKRATAGFLTAYAVVYVEDGKVTLDKSDDIYELDKKFNKKIAIPEALGRYLTTEKYFNLRDMNISPDFKVSMDLFLENYKSVRGEPQDIDGIIAVDTNVLTDVIKVLGPVEVPGYGTFSAENDPKCDCPQIIYALSEIITRPTPYLRQDRKGILGPLMRATLTKAYTAPKQQWPALFEAGWKNIESRHVQMYFFDEKAQAAAESINGAGLMKTPEAGHDFLAIIDSNLGGAKSNLFITYDVKQTVSAPENGLITKTVEVTYKNNRHGDNCNLEAGLLCLNSTLRDWHRVYLPAGAKLVEAQGFTQAAKEYDEAGFHVIDGYFILEPNSQAKVKYTYTLPFEGSEYKLKVWHQGGTDPTPHLIDVNGNETEVVVNKDTVVTSKFE